LSKSIFQPHFSSIDEYRLSVAAGKPTIATKLMATGNLVGLNRPDDGKQVGNCMAENASVNLKNAIEAVRVLRAAVGSYHG
jgi:lipopolysaccharide export system protein LptC